MDPLAGKSPIEAPMRPGMAPASGAAPVGSTPPAAPVNRATGTGGLSDARVMRPTGTSTLSIDAAKPPAKVGTTGLLSRLGAVGGVAAALGELGVVGALAEVAKAYASTTFDPAAISASLGKFAENLQNVSSQVQSLPGVGDALLGLGGLGAIVSGIKGLREGISAAKSAQDTPEKVQASLGAAAGAAKIVGGVAAALTPFCPPLGAVGAAVIAAGVAMDAGKLAMENRAPLARALWVVQVKIGSMISPETRQAIDQATKIVSNNGASMVRASSA
jgi:hypothetical protein